MSSTTPASKFGNTYGLSPAFLESLNINGPLITKVFVANVSIVFSKFEQVFECAPKFHVYLMFASNANGIKCRVLQ